MTFEQWWYDYCIKSSIGNTPKREELARVAFLAGQAQRAEGAPSKEALDAARYVMDNARDASENETIMANEIVRLAGPEGKR